MSRAPPGSVHAAPASSSTSSGRSGILSHKGSGSGTSTPRNLHSKGSNGVASGSSSKLANGSAAASAGGASSTSSIMNVHQPQMTDKCSHFDALQVEVDGGKTARMDKMKERFKKVTLWAARQDTLERHAVPAGNGNGNGKEKTGGSLMMPSCSSCKPSRIVRRPLACLECDFVFCRKLPPVVAGSASPGIAGETAKAATAGGSRAPPGESGSAQGVKARFRDRWSLKPVKDEEGEDVRGEEECWDDHAKQSGHVFAIDSSTGSMLCAGCHDFIYPDSISLAYERNKRFAEEKADWSIENGRERKKFKALKADTYSQQTARWQKVRCLGLRPLLNLSQTCFLSAILQAFLHNPLWKSYYLSEGHNRKVCELRRALNSKTASMDGSVNGDENNVNGDGEVVGNPAALTTVGECIGCEMDTAFYEAHNEDNTPFGPVALLYSMWKASSELAGHAQQDAHTFFLAALNQVHAHTSDMLDAIHECPCIAHRSFSGSLQSTVTCSRCGSSTNTFDPILDISLELKSGAVQDKDLNTLGLPPGRLSLAECLRRYTAQEALSGKAYACSKCGGDGYAEATKQLSINRLPNTLAIQLKRFEQNSTNFSKVDTIVHFPTVLDMQPYMTETLQRDPNLPPGAYLPDEMYRYELSTVVTHEGRLDNGHYWADVKSGCEWFHCDDDKITPTTLSQVLSQKAYMLFYVKTSIAYDPTPKT